MPFFGITQGLTCANPINLTLDGVLRTYGASSGTGNNVLCTANGTTPVTWFKFTTDPLAQCPLLNITASDSLACEVGFYTSCSSMLTSSSMCFYNGYGLWAPNQNFTISPNTVYYLRVKTSTACTIKIAGQHFTPPNDDCFGALSISNVNINDNNACDHPGPGVTAPELCANTLENTAWYKFYVRDSGYSIISITNIHCANGATNNNNGFQIGFFTGTCSALQWINCANGSGTNVQATTNVLPAGTRVYVAIDGISGSNCSYAINGFNVTGILGGGLKYFSGWKTNETNLLQWMIVNEQPGYYVIERSADGVNFQPIGRVNSGLPGNDDVTYHFEDHYPPVDAFYRLRQFDYSGKIALSNIIHISRTGLSNLQISLTNPAGKSLNLDAAVENAGTYHFNIFNMQGQKIKSFTEYFATGINHKSMEIANLPAGQYCLVTDFNRLRINKMFVIMK